MLPVVLHNCFLWGIQTYQRASKHMGASKHTGDHPNIWGASKHIVGILMYEGIWTPTWSDKACFLCVVYVQQLSEHHQNIQGASEHRRASKYMGQSKHTGGCLNILGCPNIQEASKHTGGIQTYVGCLNIWKASKYLGCPNIQGAFLHVFLSHKVAFATSTI